jgi:hypothetical protein
MADTKISAAAGETGGPTEPATLTTNFLRQDGLYITPFSSVPPTIPATPTGQVAGYSALGGDVTTAGGGMYASVNAQGLTGLHPVTIPASLLITATTLASFTTAATIASGSIPAADVTAGATYLLKCSGIVSSTGTPTYTFSAGYGATAIAALGAITTGSGIANQSWEAEFLLQFYSTILAAGVLRLQWGTSTSTDAASSYLASSGNAGGGNSGAGGVTVTSATAKTINLTVACSASSASNTISALTCVAQRVA